jgi:valyl-tRNA synthetase
VTDDESAIPENAVSAAADGARVFLPLDGLIDREAELVRLNKEKANLEGELARARAKLENESFLSKAPRKVVDEERKKLEKYRAMLEMTLKNISELGGK